MYAFRTFSSVLMRKTQSASSLRQRSISGEVRVVFTGSVRSWLRRWQLILRILHSGIRRIPYYHIWTREPPEALSFQCFEKLNSQSIFLCHSHDFDGSACKYRTDVPESFQKIPVFYLQFYLQHRICCKGCPNYS